MTVTTLGVFAVLVWMAHRSIRATRLTHSRLSSPTAGALAIAARRFRSGEITAKELDRIAHVLRT